MLLFKDILDDDDSNNDLFTDAYKYEECFDGLCYKIQAKSITRKKGGDNIVLAGANPSAEEEQEQFDDGVETESGINIALEYNLENYTDYIDKKTFKDYIQAIIKKKLPADKKQHIKECMEKNKKCLNDFMAIRNEKDVDVLGSQNIDFEDPNRTLMLAKWAENGTDVDIYVLKDCLKEEKL